MNDKPFFIHAKLVSRHSAPLGRMINGSTAVAQRDCAVIRGVDEGTFERYVEWSYKEHYTVPGVIPVATDSTQGSPPPNQSATNEDYTEVFLCHARLYVFADRYFIQPLKTLALEELRRVLSFSTLDSARADAILALFLYVSAETDNSPSGGRGMRELMHKYVDFNDDDEDSA